MHAEQTQAEPYPECLDASNAACEVYPCSWIYGTHRPLEDSFAPIRLRGAGLGEVRLATGTVAHGRAEGRSYAPRFADASPIGVAGEGARIRDVLRFVSGLVSVSEPVVRRVGPHVATDCVPSTAVLYLAMAEARRSTSATRHERRGKGGLR